MLKGMLVLPVEFALPQIARVENFTKLPCQFSVSVHISSKSLLHNYSPVIGISFHLILRRSASAAYSSTTSDHIFTTFEGIKSLTNAYIKGWQRD